MRGLGVVSVLSAVVINVVLLIQSSANPFMDSGLKMSMEMFSANPALFVLSIVLFFGGFALAVFGDEIGFVRNIKHKNRIRKIVKNKRKRQEALRSQRERLMK